MTYTGRLLQSHKQTGCTTNIITELNNNKAEKNTVPRK